MTNAAQSWNPSLYDGRHSFVYKAAADMIELLAPRQGERIVDLGCGTGHLTAAIAASGAQVVGLDASPAMVEQAQRNFPALSFRVADAVTFTVDEPQDAVFSNAVLHWVHPPTAALQAIAAALRPGGRFVAEFGGRGCVARIVAAVNQSLGTSDAGGQWFFPSVGEYAPLVEAHGFEVRFARLFDRPTPLEEGDAGLKNWLSMFAGAQLARLDAAQQETLFADVAERLRPAMWDTDHWVADYRRIRIVAVKL